MDLLPENIAQQNGSGAAIALDDDRGSALLLKLGITRCSESESLEVLVMGSPDGEHWTLLETFPRRNFCGTYSLLLDLSDRTEIRYLQAQWRMSSWGSHKGAPLFEFYLAAEPAAMHALAR